MEVTDVEIIDVINSIPIEKAPGVDGLQKKLSTTQCVTVQHSTCQAVKDFFKKSKWLESFSSTTITLVAKVTTLAIVKDYTTIACCTTFYKIITKILTNRIKWVIGSFVSLAQLAFINRGSIIHDILINHKVLKWYTRKYLSPRCVLKVDLGKAYVSCTIELSL